MCKFRLVLGVTQSMQKQQILFKAKIMYFHETLQSLHNKQLNYKNRFIYFVTFRAFCSIQSTYSLYFTSRSLKTRVLRRKIAK